MTSSALGPVGPSGGLARLRLALAATSYEVRLSAIVLLGAVLRLAFLARQPYWRDEAFTAVVARMPLGDLLDAVSRDSAPPLSYLIEHVASGLGDAPWLLRVVPALAGIALIAIVAALARRVAGDAAGLAAAALVATLPSTVLLSEDARMYGIAAMLAGLAALLLWRAVEAPSAARWLAYAAAAGLSLWTVYFAALAIGAALAAILLMLRPRRRVSMAAIGWTAVAAATLVPWLVFARTQLDHAGGTFWIPPASLSDAGSTVAQLIAGPYVDEGVPYRQGLQVLQGLAIAVVIGSFGSFGIAWGRGRLAGRSDGSASVLARPVPVDARRGAWLCLVAGAGALAALGLVSVWRSLLEARYASVLWVPLLALAGVGLAAMPRRLAAVSLAALVVGSVALSASITHPETDRLVPSIEARMGLHDLVEAYPTQYLMLLLDGSPALRARLHVVGQDVSWFWGTVAYPAGAIVPSIPPDVVANRGQILDVREPQDPPPHLAPGYRRTDQVCVVRVCLTVYSPPG